MIFPEFQSKYINLVEGDVNQLLAQQKESFAELIEGLSEEKLNYRYAEKKWSLREVILHVIDTEQIFNYRFLCGLRGEQKELPGFNQDEFIDKNTSLDHDSEYLLNYFTITRYNSLVLFKALNPQHAKDTVKISGYEMSLAAFPYMVAGHLLYHVNIIKERYL